jgi:hypothetical protein
MNLSKQLGPHARRLLSLPPVKWDAYLTRLLASPDGFVQAAQTRRQLDGLCESAARLAAYVGEREGYGCGDQGHDAAVRKQNRVAGNVRKALGYTYKSGINF